MRSGCGHGLLLWRRCLPAEQLERLRWHAGVCVTGGHPGLHRVSGWKQNPGDAAGASAASHSATAQVRRGLFFSCLSPTALKHGQSCICLHVFTWYLSVSKIPREPVDEF